MAVLKDILVNVTAIKVQGDLSASVSGLYIDSRKVTAGSAFIAVKGTLSDGHAFIDKALELGASVIVCENMPADIQGGVTYVQVKNSAAATGLLADAFYGHPSKQLKVVGVTGTNGKTTVATLLYSLFEGLGYKSGLLSTVQNHIHNEVVVSTHTTPDAISIQGMLRRMVDAGCTHAFMEVSSHAIHHARSPRLS
jgi:UDP-N-acetylmuramoyl-L-alanyl-D-glutamate--2,6-diaminopimelate ligase